MVVWFYGGVLVLWFFVFLKGLEMGFHGVFDGFKWNWNVF